MLSRSTSGRKKITLFAPTDPKRSPRPPQGPPRGVQKNPSSDQKNRKMHEKWSDANLLPLLRFFLNTRFARGVLHFFQTGRLPRKKATIFGTFWGILGISLGAFWGLALRKVLPRGTPENTRFVRGVLQICMEKNKRAAQKVKTPARRSLGKVQKTCI